VHPLHPVRKRGKAGSKKSASNDRQYLAIVENRRLVNNIHMQGV
jgi:hypothetical protein